MKHILLYTGLTVAALFVYVAIGAVIARIVDNKCPGGLCRETNDHEFITGIWPLVVLWFFIDCWLMKPIKLIFRAVLGRAK